MKPKDWNWIMLAIREPYKMRDKTAKLEIKQDWLLRNEIFWLYLAFFPLIIYKKNPPNKTFPQKTYISNFSPSTLNKKNSDYIIKSTANYTVYLWLITKKQIEKFLWGMNENKPLFFLSTTSNNYILLFVFSFSPIPLDHDLKKEKK